MHPRSVKDGPVSVRSTLSRKHPILVHVADGLRVGSELHADVVVEDADVLDDWVDAVVVVDVVVVELSDTTEGDGRRIDELDEGSVGLEVAGVVSVAEADVLLGLEVKDWVVDL